MGYVVLYEPSVASAIEDLPEVVRDEIKDLIAEMEADPYTVDAQPGTVPFKGFDYEGFTATLADGEGFVPYIVQGNKVRVLHPIYKAPE